jgi:hypothetical protein
MSGRSLISLPYFFFCQAVSGNKKAGRMARPSIVTLRARRQNQRDGLNRFSAKDTSKPPAATTPPVMASIAAPSAYPFAASHPPKAVAPWRTIGPAILLKIRAFSISFPFQLIYPFFDVLDVRGQCP